MWGNVNGMVEIACTDGNPSYRELFDYDIDTRHIVSKAETCLVESYNSVLRYYLARLQRRTKCYSKSQEILRLSVLLLVHSFNTIKIRN
jgi:insertion element IS1 protein InsB